MTSILISIFSVYRICIQSFNRLHSLLQTPECEFSGEVSLTALENELGRFRVWAGNVGAHRNGRVSLDYKLREAPNVHEEVTDLLKELDEALQEAIAILSYERKPYDQLSWSSGSSVCSLEIDAPIGGSQEEENSTELQERFLEVAHIITCLYRFSIAIRNPVPQDRLEKCATIITSHYEFFDIQHVSNKFPSAEKHLFDRLGRANSRRRQLFMYYAKHHDKLTRYIDLVGHQDSLATVAMELGQNDTIDDENNPEEVLDDLGHPVPVRKSPGTIAATVNTQTTVSTYVQRLSNTIEVSSDSGQSQTSYASSASGDTGSKLRLPPPPNSDRTLDGEPFECPYCFSMITVSGSKSWMKHVFRDLRPYVCTFIDCSKPGRLFNSRHDWYDHELEAHRREWLCNACHKSLLSKTIFASHMREIHPGLFTETQLPTIIDRCERAIENTEQTCPLCRDRYPPRRLKSHLAHHMQQLAQFTLPRASEEAKDDVESARVQASQPDDQSSLGNVALDMSSMGSSQDIVGSISSAQHEVPETEDEKWRQIQDLEYADSEQKTTLGIDEHKEQQQPTIPYDLETEALEQMRTLPGNPDTWDSIERLATEYFSKGRFSEAVGRQGQVLEARQTILGREHPDTLSAMATLASIYLKQGRHKEAEELQIKALEGMERVLGREHPDTLSATASLASTCLEQGRFREAGEHQTKALEGMERVLGKEHPDTLSTRALLVSMRKKIITRAECLRYLKYFIHRKADLRKFYDDEALDQKSKIAMEMGNKLMEDGCSKECAVSLIVLTLYDIAMLLDDSESMLTEEGGRPCRLAMRETITAITSVYDYANADGMLSVRFFNNTAGYKKIKQNNVSWLYKRIKYGGLTRIGSALSDKVLKKIVWSGQKMIKPLLVITITDGTVEGERSGLLKEVIANCAERTASDPVNLGKNCVVFQFAQVGSDEGAKKFLSKLSQDPGPRGHVSCLPADFRLENLPGEKWNILPMLLLGAIDPDPRRRYANAYHDEAPPAEVDVPGTNPNFEFLLQPIENDDYGDPPDGIQSLRPDLSIQGSLTTVAHGKLTPDGPRATLIVAQLRFASSHHSHRFCSAITSFRFQDDQDFLRSSVQKIFPFGDLDLDLSQNHQPKQGVGEDVGVNVTMTARNQADYELTKTSNHQGRGVLSGRIRIEGRNYGSKNAARWSMSENEIEKTKIPTFLRVAILLERNDERIFFANIKVQAKVDILSTPEDQTQNFSGSNKIDSIQFDPSHKPIGDIPQGLDLENLLGYPLENLGGLNRDTTLQQVFPIQL